MKRKLGHIQHSCLDSLNKKGFFHTVSFRNGWCWSSHGQTMPCLPHWLIAVWLRLMASNTLSRSREKTTLLRTLHLKEILGVTFHSRPTIRFSRFSLSRRAQVHTKATE